MQIKKVSKSFKETQIQSAEKRISVNSDDPRVRVLQYDLVFVNGLPYNIANLDILQDELHFGRYGKVVKSILNPSCPYKKGVNYQAYATYESEIDASLAIVALDGITLYDRPLKVSYGTTKYCTYFLKGRQCTNDDCFYLHKYQKENEVINGDTRSIFKNQYQRAIHIVLNNIESIIERVFQSQIQNVQQGFPSLSETIDFLIDNGYLDQKKYYQIQSKINQRNREDKSVQKSKISNLNSQQAIDASSVIDQTPKLAKSSSFSTMTSPNKPQTSTSFDDSEKRIYEIDPKQKSLKHDISNLSQKCDDRTARSDNQNKKDYGVSIDFDEKIQERISHKIIKEIMKKKGIKSRFDFVKIDLKSDETLEQIKKVKNIMQRFLITFQ